MSKRIPRDGNFPVTLPHRRFLEVTCTRYHDLKQRVRKFYRIDSMELPYTLDQYRDWVRFELNGEQGVARCVYCDAYINLETMQTEHHMPLAQGGALQFDNLRVACEPCNQQKGKMRPHAFLALKRLVNSPGIFSAVDRDNVLGRLQVAMKLAKKVQAHAKRQRLANQTSFLESVHD